MNQGSGCRRSGNRLRARGAPGANVEPCIRRIRGRFAGCDPVENNLPRGGLGWLNSVLLGIPVQEHVSTDLLIRMLASQGYRVRVSVVKSGTVA